MNFPILYSFRRCPYAIRARLAIAYSNIPVELREVILKHKPQEMLSISPKATVPVLQFTDMTILDESLDIMFWAITKNDPDKIHLNKCSNYLQNELIAENDNVFKMHLDHYKYADRFPAYSANYYRQQAEVFINKLDDILSKHAFLSGKDLSVIDFAIFPFIRQFAFVDKAWFDQSKYCHVQKWLNYFLNSNIFNLVMYKFDQWICDSTPIIFPLEKASSMLES